jgi:SHS2 domain-containing protein
MTFENFEHEADIGVRGTGKSIEESFQEAAKAMFSIEVSIAKVKAKNKNKIKASASNLQELLVEWLNKLLAESGIKGMMFSKFMVKIHEKDKKYLLEGYAAGEKLDVKRHQAREEVKAATYSQLKVEKNKKGQWVSQCIVDV